VGNVWACAAVELPLESATAEKVWPKEGLATNNLALIIPESLWLPYDTLITILAFIPVLK